MKKPENRKKCRWPSWVPATQQQVAELGKQIMSAISEFAEKMDAHNEAISKGISGIAADIQKLQTSSGVVSPEDQATINRLESRTKAVAEAITALDDLTSATESPEPAPPA